MNIQQIKEKLNSSEYDFLRENEHLGNNIILLTVGGSHAYGTNVETSDLDIRGIALERIQELIGLNSFEIFDNSQTDTTIYAFRKIINLMLNSNPNVIEMLGTNDDQLFILSEEGKMLRDNVNLFLSKKVIHSFGGYATSQLRRLQNALARDNYPQGEKEVHIMNSILTAMAGFENKYAELVGEPIKLSIGDSDKKDFDKEIFMDINLSHYPLRDFKSIYSEMHNVVKDYGSLNHRNSKKDDLHLNKHAMHLIRLLIMGTEILEGKGINTYREKDRDFLLKIRNGEFVQKKGGKDDYTLIFDMVDDYEKRFKYAAENTSLPAKPNYNKINELVIEMNRGVISDYRK